MKPPKPLKGFRGDPADLIQRFIQKNQKNQEKNKTKQKPKNSHEISQEKQK